ncbi:MAG: DUF2807 domain-containing protein [Bacteroidales bacterium]|nr:DUF2807 domain-containing protein [Bacteroidales bacterium]
MNKKSFFMALLVFVAVLGAKAQTNKVYKADTVIDGNGNKIITVYSQGTFAEGNGNIITRDFDMTSFDEISIALSASVTYAVADKCSCRVTLDENLFECLDIYQKGDCLRVEMVKTLQQSDLKPTKFLIELTAPTLEEISLVGGGDFSFVTPFEAQRLEISTAGAHGVFFDETATIQHFKMSLAGAGKLVCKDLHADRVDWNVAGVGNLVCKNLHADHANLGVAGSGGIVIEAGKVKSADISVAGTGSVEARCELESMDYNISGWGNIKYYGDVKVKGTCMGGKIKRIDSENAKNKEKCCHEKSKKTKN